MVGKWEVFDFDEVISDNTKDGIKIKKEDYLESGRYPIIDQGQNVIAGYSNTEKGLFEKVPAIIFGDHTRVIKYIETPFFLGADGVKLLKCKKSNCDYKYLYYFFIKNEVENTGYNRHFKWLKELRIPLPPLEVQRKIAETLDAASELLAMRKTQLAELDKLIQAVFCDLFGDPLANERAWKQLTWNQVLFIRNGRNQKAVEDVNGSYPIYGSGGIMGFANNYICNENTVVIGRKGNINKPILVKEKFWNVDTAFGLEPNVNFINVNYLFLFCKIFNFERLNKTVTIPSLTKSDLLRIVIPVPPLLLQTQFAEAVQKIEEQKALVQKAIDETQALFDSLMGEYFE